MCKVRDDPGSTSVTKSPLNAEPPDPLQRNENGPAVADTVRFTSFTPQLAEVPEL